MSRNIQICKQIKLLLRHELNIEFLLLIACVSLMCPQSVTNFSKLTKRPINFLTIIYKSPKVPFGSRFKCLHHYRYENENNKKVETLKYILLWTSQSYSPFYLFGKRQKAFIDQNCSVKTCYVTTNRNYFNGDITMFDYIFFNGRTTVRITKADIPINRSSHQNYVYLNLESSYNAPTCNVIYDDFFNLTATYRLDSDIPFPYIQVKNIKGEVVAPKIEMDWIEDGAVDKDLAVKLKNKTKAAAWFVSKCNSKSERRKYVNNLQKALVTYNLSVDIYGECGPLKCPRNHENCSTMLGRDYFFYLSFENSFAVDYVTEKLLRAMQNDVVPIVYGGANYSRFLPPGSYLNAVDTTPTELAATIVDLMKSYEKYSKFFVWKSHYTYHNPVHSANVCAVCKALNDKSMEKPKYYKYFRNWWQSNYYNRCNRGCRREVYE